MDLAFNLDHDQAASVLRTAAAAAPDDSATHRALAAVLWTRILYDRGAVTVDHYLGGFNQSAVDLAKPAPKIDEEFRREIARAIDLAERRVKASPKDAQAHYDLGTAVGLEASYIATVEGRLLAGFKAARRSYDEEETVLALEPSRKNAGLIVGTYRYIVSTLALPMRFMAYVVGFGGGKARGIRMVEEAAAYPNDVQTDAMFALVLMYNREQRYDDALRVLDRLRAAYPRNRLVLLEAGATAIRGLKAQQAESLLSDGIRVFEHDSRAKIPGEAALWHYKRGAARVLLHRRDDALADLKAALAPDAALWVQGRAHLELARLSVQQGDRATAQREARQAAALCSKGNDPLCVEDAQKAAR